VARLTEEKTGIDISDSVVMGDVQQNILKTDVCPSCSASNVRVMKCQEVGCTSKQFCELCHINCRYSEGSSTRFDSGVGLGPLCSECLDAKFAAWKKRLEQLERERLERERLERIEQERLERVRILKKNKLLKKTSITIIIAVYIVVVYISSLPEGLWDGQWYTDGVLDDEGFRVFMSGICCAPILVSPLLVIYSFVFPYADGSSIFD